LIKQVVYISIKTVCRSGRGGNSQLRSWSWESWKLICSWN